MSCQCHIVILSYSVVLMIWYLDLNVMMSWCHDVMMSWCHVVMLSWCNVTPGYDVGMVHVPSADDPVSTMNWRELASWAVLSLALWPLLLQDSEYWSKELDNNVSSSDHVISIGPPAINGGDEKLMFTLSAYVQNGHAKLTTNLSRAAWAVQHWMWRPARSLLPGQQLSGWPVLSW